MNQYFKNALLLATILIIVSCNQSPSKPNKDSIYANYIKSNQLISLEKIRAFRFQSWNALDYRHLIVSGSPKKSYLLTLDFYCNDLRHTPNIHLIQTMNNALVAKFDSIIVPGNPVQKCRIKSIHPLTKKQKNELTGLRKKTK